MNAGDIQRLKHILMYCNEIQETIERYGASLDVFLDDKDYRKSVSLSLLEIGEISKDLSPEFKAETRERIPWGLVVGFRNHVAHGYRKLDFEDVYDTALNDIPGLKRFCEEKLVTA